MPLGILAVQLVLDVPTRQEQPLRRARAREHDPAAFGGILRDRLGFDPRELLRRERHPASAHRVDAGAAGGAPPAGPACPPAGLACPPGRAGMVGISSPALRAGASPP